MTIRNLANKDIFKRILSLLVVFCIAVGVIVPITMYSPEATGTPTKKMIHITDNGTAKTEFYRDVTLVKGKTYDVSFKMLLKNGEFGKTDSLTFNLFAKNKSGDMVTIFGGDFTDNQRGVEPVYDKNTKVVTYTFAVKDNAINKSAKKVTLKNGNNDCAIGFSFNGLVSSESDVSPTDLYISDLSVVATDDDSKTNLLAEVDTQSDLVGWHTSSADASGLTVSENGMTAQLMIYDILTFDPDAKPEVVLPEKMTYYKNNEQAVLGKMAKVDAGKTYYFSYSYATDLNSAVEINSIDSPVTALAKGSLEEVAITSKIIAKYEYGTYVNVVYTIEMPADIATIAEDSTVFIGPKLNAGVEGYIFGATFYDSESIDRVELLSNAKYEKGVKDYAVGATVITDETNEWTDGDKQVKIVAFDASNFAKITPAGAPTKPNEKMLYYKSGISEFVGTRATVVPGDTYEYTFSYASGVEMENCISFGTMKVSAIANGDMRGGVSISTRLKERAVSESGKYVTATYTVTIPSDLSAEGNVIMVGFTLPSHSDCYIFNTHFCRADDPEKRNILGATTYSGGLDGISIGSWIVEFPLWCYVETDYDIKEPGLAEWKDKAGIRHAKIVDFDEALFKTVEAEDSPTSTHRMLHFKSNTSGPLMNRFAAKPNTTYNFTFSITNTVESFGLTTLADGERYGVPSTFKLVNKTAYEGYSTYEYEVTTPSTLSVDLMFLGLSFDVGSEGYIFDISLTKKGGKGKELFTNNDFLLDLDYWAWGWEVWFAVLDPGGLYEWANTTTNLRVVDFDEEVVKNFKVSTPETMVYFKNGANVTPFSAWISTNATKKIMLEYTVFATEEIKPDIKANGDRGGITGTVVNLESKVDGPVSEITKQPMYTSYKYSIIIPDTYTDGLVFLGLEIPSFAEGYVWDMKCYLASDELKASLWANPKFRVGFNGWIWGWHAWFNHPASGADANLNEWTNGVDELKLVNKNIDEIKNFIWDLNRDDGVWWTPEQYDENAPVDKGTATVKGTFKNQKGNPISGIKLVLKSETKAFNATTDKDGVFSFKDVPVDYYDLYYLDRSGKEVSTGYGSTINKDDTVDINIVTDMSALSDTIIRNDVEEEEEKVKVSSFAGTVYTPKLKTVPGLKMYLRDFGETVTDDNGSFAFNDVPVGDYELYTVLENGKEYVFRTVKVEEGKKVTMKLKFDPPTDKKTSVADKNDNAVEETTSNIWLWIIVIGAIVVVVAAGAVAIIVIVSKKKKLN